MRNQKTMKIKVGKKAIGPLPNNHIKSTTPPSSSSDSDDTSSYRRGPLKQSTIEAMTRSLYKSTSRPGRKGKCFSNPRLLARSREQSILRSASWLRDTSDYVYGPMDEIRTCIWSGGDPIVWKQKSSGVSWIGVAGTDATYVVSMTKGKTGPRPCPTGRRLLEVKKVLLTALADMSGASPADMAVWDVPAPSIELRQRMIKMSSSQEVGPFAVVSVAPDFVEEEISNEGQLESLAFSFLTETLKGREFLSSKATKKIAIFALRLLLGSKFMPDKIEVLGFGNLKGGVGILSADEVYQSLAAIQLGV